MALEIEPNGDTVNEFDESIMDFLKGYPEMARQFAESLKNSAEFVAVVEGPSENYQNVNHLHNLATRATSQSDPTDQP